MQMGRRWRGTCRASIVLCAILATIWSDPRAAFAASDVVLTAVSATASCGALPAIDPVAHLGGIERKLDKLSPIRVLAIGSSSTQGVGASSPAHSYPARLEADLRKHWPKDNLSVTNAGIGGETLTTTVPRLEHLLATQHYDLVIWQLGTNDALAGVDPDTFRKLTIEGVVAARAAGDDLVMLDPQYFPGIHDPQRYERFVNIIEAVGRNEHVPVFRRYAMMKRLSAQSADLLATLSPDHFHMNDHGYDCLAEGLTKDIGQMAAAPAVAAGTTQSAALTTMTAQ